MLLELSTLKTLTQDFFLRSLDEGKSLYVHTGQERKLKPEQCFKQEAPANTAATHLPASFRSDKEGNPCLMGSKHVPKGEYQD